MAESDSTPREMLCCDECCGDYFAGSSQMLQLCPECAHYLYGYPLCNHLFVDQRCTKCGWNGSRSKYILELIETDRKHSSA